MINGQKVSLVFPAYNEEKNISRAVKDFSKLKIIDEIIVINIDRMQFLAGFASNSEPELLSRMQVQSSFQVAGPDSRPLSVHENAGVNVQFGRNRPNMFNNAAHPIVRAVRHIQSKNIHAGDDQLANHLGGLSGGTERGDNLRFPHQRQERRRKVGRFQAIHGPDGRMPPNALTNRY